MSGLQSLRSLRIKIIDHFEQATPTLLAFIVECVRARHQYLELVKVVMIATLQRLNDFRELQEFLNLHERFVSPEEGQNLLSDLAAVLHIKLQSVRLTVLHDYLPTTQLPMKQIEHSSILPMLRDMEDWIENPAKLGRGLLLDAYREAALAVREPEQVVPEVLPFRRQAF